MFEVIGSVIVAFFFAIMFLRWSLGRIIKKVKMERMQRRHETEAIYREAYWQSKLEESQWKASKKSAKFRKDYFKKHGNWPEDDLYHDGHLKS